MWARSPTSLAMEYKPAVVSQLQPAKGKQGGNGEAPVVDLKDAQILTLPQWGLEGKLAQLGLWGQSLTGVLPKLLAA